MARWVRENAFEKTETVKRRMACLKADCLDAQLFGHRRLVLPNLPDHRLGRASQSLDDALQLDHERRVDRVVARLEGFERLLPAGDQDSEDENAMRASEERASREELAVLTGDFLKPY